MTSLLKLSKKCQSSECGNNLLKTISSYLKDYELHKAHSPTWSKIDLAFLPFLWDVTKTIVWIWSDMEYLEYYDPYIILLLFIAKIYWSINILIDNIEIDVQNCSRLVKLIPSQNPNIFQCDWCPMDSNWFQLTI